ncbi:carboxypeptidase-like regulatory domain-containing protein, partial [Deinococcus malanensis]|uniref:carboxypeptidase-like regulatory domain-containing protein n=1 Tax=Deinococcus malanensis TaxID=1706855 RepID=UPI001663DB29
MKTHVKKSGMVVALLLSMALSACTETGTVPPVNPTPPTSPAPGPDPMPPSNPVPPSDPVPTPPAPTPPAPTPPAPSPTPPSDPVPPAPTYGYITGTVVNEQGVPLPGVEVVADNTAAYNSNLIARTDAQGRYKIDVRNAPVTFNMSATMTIRYEGHSIGVNLVPDNTETVPGGVGGVRNFTFKPKPLSQADPYGNLACVFVEREPGNFSV